MRSDDETVRLYMYGFKESPQNNFRTKTNSSIPRQDQTLELQGTDDFMEYWR